MSIKYIKLVPSLGTPYRPVFKASKHFKLLATGGFCSVMTPNFTAEFVKKVENNEGIPDPLHCLELMEIMHDLRQEGPETPLGVIDELGGTLLVEVTTLEQLHGMLEAQWSAKGPKEGPMDISGKASIHYIMGASGNPMAVYNGWYNGGWLLGANPLVRKHSWYAGYRVYSKHVPPHFLPAQAA